MRGIIRSVLTLLITISVFPLMGQTYLGISANVGNRLSFSPSSPGLKRPVAISGNLTLRVQEKTRSTWVVQYGADIGVIGYNLKFVFIDTLQSGYSSSDHLLDYSNFYGNLHLLIGKEFAVQKKGLLIGLGGGVTYYCSLFGTSTFSMALAPSNSPVVYDLFTSSMSGPVNKTSAYLKFVTQLRLSKDISIGLEYSHHVKKVLEGSYQFYNTRTPSSGKISLYQRELQIIFLVNVSKRRAVS